MLNTSVETFNKLSKYIFTFDEPIVLEIVFFSRYGFNIHPNIHNIAQDVNVDTTVKLNSPCV